MTNRQFKNSIIFLLLSIITLVSSVFAWMNLSKSSEIGGISSNIPNFTNLIDFWVKRNNDKDFIEIKTITDMHQTFGNTLPGETYTFKLKINNKTEKEISMFAAIYGFETIFTKNYEDYDLRNVFYIENGLVNIAIYKEEQLIRTNDYTLEVNDESDITIHNQLLNKYRINNLIDETGDVSLFPTQEIKPHENLIITFKLVYDANTNENKYQENILRFKGIYVYGQ